MSLRNAVLTAAAGALLVWGPTDAAAQNRGLDRASIATAHAESKAGWKHGRAVGRGSALPPGIARKSADRQLPPGLRRWFGGDESGGASEPDPEVQPEVQPEPETQPEEECGSDLAFVDGMLVYVDCNGNVTGSGGLPGI